MITYTYIVRCPECEDEFFDFFDEAKDFAMGCLTKKPIITQTEVQRNDFGECTDHCDLGTVWSWEDMMRKETDAEPATSVFTKDDLKCTADGKDPEFDNIDNSVDFEISEGLGDFDDFDIGPQSDELIPPEFDEDPIEPVEEAISKVQADYLSRRNPMTKEEFAERLEVEDEILIFTGDPRELGIRGRDYFAAKVDGKYEVSFWDETYEDEFTDSEVAETFDNIDDLWAFMVEFMEDDDFNPEYNYLAEGCGRKPVNENALRDGGFRADGYRTALACYDTDDFDINVEFGIQNEDEYEVEDQLYLLRPGQTVADLVVYLSRECGFTNIYVYGETGAYGNDRKTATKFETVPGKHDYRDYGTIENRLVEKCNRNPIVNATRAPKDSDYVIVLKHPRTGKYYFFSRQFTITGDLNKAMTYPDEFSAEDEIKYAVDAAEHANFTFTIPFDHYKIDTYYDDNPSVNFSATTVAEAKKLSGVADKMSSPGSLRKPIPEGMTIEQLVEEMEENEDTVECSKCGNLVEKANCHHNQESFGWCCNTCEPADTLVVESKEVHDLGNTYDGGYPEDEFNLDFPEV